MMIEHGQKQRAKLALAKTLADKPDGLKWFVVGDDEHFTHSLMSASVSGRFVYSDKSGYLEQYCDRLAEHMWTMTVAPRDHFKTFGVLAEVLHIIFTAKTDISMVYISYRHKASANHVNRIIQGVKLNPYFKDVSNEKVGAETKFRFVNSYGATITCVAEGIDSGIRGGHYDLVICDDLYKDDASKLDPTIIRRVNRLFKSVVIPMINKGGRCRVIGTRFTQEDMFVDPNLSKQFNVWQSPAIIDEAKGIVLWPEWASLDYLISIKETIGDKVFQQEYQGVPAYDVDNYVEPEQLKAITDNKLKPLQRYSKDVTIAGFDIGKKRHPSHLAIFKQDNKGKVTQVLSKFLDHWDYSDQLEYLRQAIDDYSIAVCYYDATDRVFDGFDERGELPPELEPVVFTLKTKKEMASNFNSFITQDKIRILPDPRQANQIQAVTNDLKAIETSEGHGDCFWSIALALKGVYTEPKIRTL